MTSETQWQLAQQVDRDEAHRLARHRFADRLGVGGVRLAAFHVWFDIGWRDQPHLMPEGRDLARPIVCATARLEPDQTPRRLPEKAQYVSAPQRSAYYRRSLEIGGMDLENLLGEIQPDRGNLFHGTAPCLRCCQQRPR